MVGFPQPRAQDVFAAEDIQRPIAIRIVVAVEKAPFLIPLQWPIGRVHIQHHLLGSLLLGFQKHLHPKFVHTVLPIGDLLVPILCPCAQFHPVQRALARQRLLQLLPARQNTQYRISPQLLVSVPILLAQRQTINPLREHLQNRMLHLLLIPPVQKTICQSRQQIHPPVNLAQEESAAVGADRAAVKTGHDLARTAGFKPKTELVTLCRSKAVSSLAQTCCGKYVYARIGGLLLHLCEISGLKARLVNEAPPDYLPMREALKTLGVSRQTVLQRVKRGELAAVHVGGGKRKGLRIKVIDTNPGLFELIS